MKFERTQKSTGTRGRRLLRNLAVLLVLAQAIGLEMTRNARRVHADSAAGAPLNFSAARQVAAVYQGSSSALQAMWPGRVSPLSMASADFDVDGIADVAVGFSSQGGGLIAIHRGNLDAYAPQSAASFQAIASGNAPSPYLPEARVVELPVRPDFLTAGDVFGERGPAVIAAARGGSALYVVARGASGKMEVVQTVASSGAITALSAHQLQPGKYAQVVVGAHGANGPELDVYSGSSQGLSQVSSFHLSSDATAFASGNLDGDASPDVLVLAGGAVSILHGGSQTLEPVQVPYPVSSAVLGRFLFDRDGLSQMALLATDGSLHILAQDSLNSRPFTVAEVRTLRQATHQHSPARVAPPPQREVTWKEMENYPAAGTNSPLMYRTRVSNNGADDILLVSAARMSLVVHTDVNPNSGVVIDRTDLGVNAVAALPMRVNFDGRPGLVYVKSGELAPFIQAASDPTFFLNEFDDPAPPTDLSTVCNNGSSNDFSSSCSLREAILKANADTGNTDTIMVAAGTYTLSLAKVAGDYSGFHGALYVNNSMNIVGAGQATTIIQAGSSKSHGVDMVMAVNEDINPTTTATASISGLTMQFGTNKGSEDTSDGDGGGMEFDTGTNGTSNLTLTNVTLTDNQTTDGSGGGIALFSFVVPTGSGNSSFANCIIQNNTAARATNDGALGGGIWGSISQNVPVLTTLNNTQVLNNQVVGTNGLGGGIQILGPANGSPQSQFHGGAITGNQATSDGGGIYTNAGLTIDSGTMISNNTSGSNGGGIWVDIGPDSATFTTITVTANSATGNGGGIFVDNSGGSVTLTFSRVTGNTATGTGKDLNNNPSSSGGPGTPVTATDNWWGTNSPGSNLNASTSTCPAVALKICFQPFIPLALSAVPQNVQINNTSTVTASVARDSNNTAISTGDLIALAGLPLSGSVLSLSGGFGTFSSVQAQFQGDGTATGTFAAGSNPGTETVTATLDNAVVNLTINVVAPPTITKSFSPNPVAPGGTSTITFTLGNPNAIAIDANFADTLPAGMTVASSPSVVNNCGGAVTATALSGSIGYNAASLAPGNCTITVNVTAPGVDVSMTNSVTLNSTIAGNSTAASANLTVIAPPSAAKGFVPSTIVLGNSTTLTITITSTNSNLTLAGVAFTDILPSGLVVAANPGLSNNCGGTATATAGAPSISLAGGGLAPGAHCSVAVTVTGTTGGVKNNSVAVGSTNGGTGNTASATVTVVAPPALAKSFGASSITLGQTTTLHFQITNPNGTTLTGVGFTDALPAGLQIASPSNGLAGSCGGGAITAAPGAGNVSLSGATLTANSACNFTVNVTGIAAGTENNTTSAVSSNEGGAGPAASASIFVVAPPSIAKAFNPTSIGLNGTSTLTFTITNPGGNSVPLTGVAFTDVLPAGLTAPNSGGTACGGNWSSSSNTITLSSGTVAVNSQCQFIVTVTGATAGAHTNTTGPVNSTNGGPGNSASAQLTVISVDLTIAMTHAGNFSQGQIGDVFYVTVSNVGSGPTDGSTVTMADTMPVGFTATAIAGGGWSCTVTPLQCTRNDVLALGASYPTITIVVNVTSNAGSSLSNTATVSGGGDTTPGNDTAVDTVSVAQTSSQTLSGLIASKTGAQNARVWGITVTNNDTKAANGASITGLTLTQTSGAACTPVITGLPVALGNIAASGAASGAVTIDFTGCAAAARFTVTGQFSANAGANTGTMIENNQFR